MYASLKNYRQAPRKVRLVARAISGKNVRDAVVMLKIMPKRAGLPLAKLLESAVANVPVSARKDTLFVKEISVDKGVTLKRSRAGSRGSGFPIHKHTSHVRVALAERTIKNPKS